MISGCAQGKAAVSGIALSAKDDSNFSKAMVSVTLVEIYALLSLSLIHIYAGTDKMTMEAVSQLMLMLLLGIILIYLIMVCLLYTSRCV